MANQRVDTDLWRKWAHWLARIWSAPIILYSLIMFAGYFWDWVTNGTADPYAVENVPFIEVLPPILMFISTIGLAIAWRREKTGGLLTLGLQLVTLIVLFFERPLGGDPFRSAIPYLLSVAIIVPGVLFLLSSWRSGEGDATLIGSQRSSG
ncbi:MAG: hypothetical protein P8X64_05900 [Anaerolineales bacterium]|jgi:hypothetical protein